MKSWDRLHHKEKLRLVLSVVHPGEELTATEIIQRISEHGVEPPTPQKLGLFLRRFLEFKHFEKLRERDSRGRPVARWRLK